uniref:Ribosomal protein S8 n=1 Tax=Hirondellea gigas TaxID=1518452 RepID=A0A6A7GC75_9CRUS
MVLISVLANTMKSIVNAERRGRKQVLIRPSSKVIICFLKVMQREGYIGDFTVIDDKRRGKIVINLNGRINKCGVISPRYDVSLKKLDSVSQMLLPARQFGCVILTTSAGILTHKEAMRKKVSGKLLGYFF